MSKKNTKISLATAKKWTAKWRKAEGDYNKHHKCNGFLIPLEDFKGIIAEQPTAVAARAYIGVDENDVEKLMFVGVDANGKDMLPKKLDELDDGKGNGIFDFSQPVPPFGDPDSPLDGRD